MAESIIKLKRPHPNQLKVIRDGTRFIVMMCGRRFGKSIVAQNIGIDYLLAGKKVAYITPTYKLASLLFESIDAILPDDFFHKNKSKFSIYKKAGGGEFRFFTGKSLNAIRGFDFDIILIDEASFIEGLQDHWPQSIRPTLTDRRGRAIFLSTPKGKNYFYKLSLNENSDPRNWKTYRFTSYDNPHIPADEIDSARAEIPEANFLQEYMASPMDNADNPFGTSHIRKCIKAISDKPAKCYGIDLAKSYDYTVIIGLDEDSNVCHFDRFQLSWEETKARIHALPDRPMLLDATGVGDPILEDIQKRKQYAEGFKFTSLGKHQLMLGLAAAIQQGQVGFPEGIITSEMEIFEYTITPTGVRYSAPTGLHDDTVCALALARRHWETHGKGAKYHLY
jgi:hypothetical protein